MKLANPNPLSSVKEAIGRKLEGVIFCVVRFLKKGFGWKIDWLKRKRLDKKRRNKATT